jgi:transposase InsO family protein
MYFKLKPEFIGRDAFEAFCREEGLMSKRYRNFSRTTDSTGVQRFDNLLINTNVTRINQVWTSDITYFSIHEHFHFITFILDACSRKIVGYSVSDSLQTECTTLPALHKGIKERRNIDLTGLIFHSDGGGQYYAKEFLKLTRKKGIINSMCIYPWENGKAERLNGVIKNNYLKHKNINTYAELKMEVDRTVQLYNREKPHIALKRLSPETYERNMLILSQQTKQTMTESLDAKPRFNGAFSPFKS